MILSIIIAAIVAVILHSGTRRFVRDRLRYVDVVQKAIAPVLAGAAVMIVCLPVVAFLPLVGVGTAITAGLAVGLGVSAGVRDIKSGVTPLLPHG
jgi:hypothetical protein